MVHKLEKTSAVSLRNASLTIDGRQLWQNLNLEIMQGEFLAVLGPNGVGKTSLLRVLLGLMPLSNGTVEIGGDIPKPGNIPIGYIPQQKNFDAALPIRGRDIVSFGLNGHRYGLNLHSLFAPERINKAIADVGASAYANKPVGLLSGGEQQRLRIAQAILDNPKILLCDEPLLSLDLANQQSVSNLISQQCRKNNTTVIFVTHDIHPVLPIVDSVLYLAGTRWITGTPQEVLATNSLSKLYTAPANVMQIKGHGVVAQGETKLTNAHLPHQKHALRNGSNEWA